MQGQHHVNELVPGFWPRCREAAIQFGQLRCSLDMQDLYSLDEAYADRVHMSFLKIRTDDDLQAFVLKWGPLFPFDPQTASCVHRVAEYWSHHRCLAGLIKLVSAIRNRDGEREALVELTTALYEQGRYYCGQVATRHRVRSSHTSYQGPMIFWRRRPVSVRHP